MDDAEIVKSKVDIVEVISSYVPLKRAGRNMSGLCPFHTEKTPSFMVSPERQVFKCFGCGESGDVFTFLEKVEGWEFRETLEELAKRVGVKLTSFVPTEGGKQKERIISINAYAAKFYSYVLTRHKIGEAARAYLKKRGIKPETWERFGLGFSPLGWDRTLSFLTKRGFSRGDISASGLVVARSQNLSALSSGGQAQGKSESFDRQGFYDRFRGRLMFPLRDARGIVLGFSARTVELETRNPKQETKSEAKYVNSPETLVFNKGSLLFGLDVARAAIREKNEAILVEGEFDVLSTFQAGFVNVVASKGTALSEKQVTLLSRICERVLLCFDADLAGDKASRRGIEMLDEAGLTVKVVKMGKFKDPDEFVRADREGFRTATTQSVNIYDYFMESASRRYSVSSADGKKNIGREVIPVISKITDDLVRAHYVGKLSNMLDLDISLVSAAVDRSDNSSKGRETDNGSASDVVYDINNKSTLERYFLALMIAGDKILTDYFRRLAPSDFEDSASRRFWKRLHDIMSDSKTQKTKELIEKLGKSFAQFVDELYLVDIASEFLDREVQAAELVKIATRLKKISLKRQIWQVSVELKEAESRGDSGKVEKLSYKFNELSRILKK